jgi:hypothetical protein
LVVLTQSVLQTFAEEKMVSPASEEYTPQPWTGLEDACNALVQAMTEPLTAISNYLEAARVLSHSDAAEVREQLGGVIEKAQAQVARANAILNEMRQVLHKKNP